jgi:hypothetical protein
MRIEHAQRAHSGPQIGSRTAPSRLVLTIDRTAYVILPLPRALDPSKRAYRLIKGDGAVYDLSESSYGPSCDCPDYIFRRDGLDPAGCKHVKALVQHGLIGGR